MKRLLPPTFFILFTFVFILSTHLLVPIPESAAAETLAGTNAGTAAEAAVIAETRVNVFTNGLTSDFQDYSWNTVTAIENGELKVEITGGWGAYRPFIPNPLENVTKVVFRARGSGQTVYVGFGSNGTFGEFKPITLSGQMKNFTIEHDRTPITSIAWQDGTGNGLPKFYLDDIALVIEDTSSPQPTTTPQSTASPQPTASGDAEVQLKVDPSTPLGQIDPHIYGMSFADAELAAELDLPINRWGGNATTRYNWKESVSNRASDWFFLNVPDGAGQGVDVNNLPDTATFNSFIQQNLRTGTDSLLTASLIGWTPSGRNNDCGFPVSKYGPQDSTESYHPNCGNGTINGIQLEGRSPEDTSTAIDETYTQEWLEYINTRYGEDAVQFVALDNEPMLWNHTHRDVHPEAVGYDEIRDLALQYAPAIKQTNPQAKILGPVVWGWTAYEFSAKDQADGGDTWWQNPPDRNAHGGQPFLEWYLDEMAAYESTNGVRPLDYLDIHFYPQQEGVSLSSDVSLATQRLRLRSTRALWDPTYVDESWINESIQLIPRMKQMIANHYPGTKVAITEYEWGATGHINGALAQADVLGILGREGADMAMFWADPDASAPVSHAFRIYRNYDGRGSKFGNQGIRATSTDQEKVSVYAATRSDGALTIVLVNKSLDTIDVDLNVANASGMSQAYQYSDRNLNTIVRLDDRPINGTVSLPKNSIQMVVLGADVPIGPTTVPPTTEPPTTEPPTTEPPTTEPPTIVPPTTAPPTTAPPTTAPPTTVPPTTEPPTTVPPTTMPTATPVVTSTPVPPTPVTSTPVPPTATPVVEPTPESGVVTGQIFVDTNENGVLDPGEQALAGVTAILINVDTDGQTMTITSITNEEGIYRFVNVSAANYILSFAIPSGYNTSAATEMNLRVGNGNVAAPNLGLQAEPLERPVDGGTTTLPEAQIPSIHLPLIMK